MPDAALTVFVTSDSIFAELDKLSKPERDASDAELTTYLKTLYEETNVSGAAWESWSSAFEAFELSDPEHANLTLWPGRYSQTACTSYRGFEPFA